MENKKILYKKYIPLLITIILITTTLSGCIQQDLMLDGVEIREYNGEDLSSIYEFRENSIKGPQYINRDNYTLKITGLIENKETYTYNEIINNFVNYKKVIKLHCVEGWSVKILWEGVLVEDIIRQSSNLENITTIIFHAYDGYTTSLPVEYIIDNKILLAYKMNNVTLPPERGWPFQLVSQSKWGYKWIKWVTEIELSDDDNYKGFWERRGFSNTANLNESYID